MKDIRLIQVDTRIDARVFRDFSDFNAFVKGRRWLTLIIASVVLLVLAVVNWRTGGAWLAYICLALAIVAPVLYFAWYKVAVDGQIKKFQLEQPRKFYTVKLGPSGVDVTNDTEHAKFTWEQIYRVYERNEYFYVFITKARGYILPKADIVVGTADILRDVIKNHLPEIRYMDKRRKR